MGPEVNQCKSIITASSIGATPTVLFLFGCLQLANLGIIILYVRRQKHLAAAVKLETFAVQAADRIIFPSLTICLWTVGFANIIGGFMSLFVPRSLEKANSLTTSIAFGMSYGLSHFALDGITFLLVQNGCGAVSRARANYLATLWGSATAIIMTYRWHSDLYGIGFWLQLFWESTQLVFYAFLWLAPPSWLFRRPAVRFYGSVWTFFRAMTTTSLVLQRLKYDIAFCWNTFFVLFPFAFLQPFIIYRTLLIESQWWCGTYSDGSVGHHTTTSITRPLMGFEIRLDSAMELAAKLDELTSHQKQQQFRMRLLNFGFLKLFQHRLLGQGGTSRVYAGSFRGIPVAVKLLYVMDLTPTLIDRYVIQPIHHTPYTMQHAVYSIHHTAYTIRHTPYSSHTLLTILTSCCREALLLTKIANPNVVRMFGVAVLPPSLCLVLELCTRGDLQKFLVDNKELPPVLQVQSICTNAYTVHHTLCSYTICRYNRSVPMYTLYTIHFAYTLSAAAPGPRVREGYGRPPQARNRAQRREGIELPAGRVAGA
jgi:hypothetical protein